MNFGEVLTLMIGGLGALAAIATLHVRLMGMMINKRNGTGGGYGFGDDDRRQLMRIATACERQSEASTEMVVQLRTEIREAREFREVHDRRIMQNIDDFRCRYPVDE